MKKSWFMVSVLVIAMMILTACGSCVAKGNILQMFSAQAVLYYPEGRSLAFYEYHDRYADVLVDGNVYSIIDPDNNSYVIVGRPGKNGMMEFDNPVPVLTFRSEEEGNWIGTYNAFFSGYNTIPGIEKETFGMLVIKTEDMPEFVSERLWNGTKTQLCVWQYPESQRVVQNASTGEIVHVNTINTVNDKHVFDGLYNGQCFTGYVLVDANNEIYITQSEPDLIQMNLAYEKSIELFGANGVDDAIDACTHTAYWMVKEHGITKEQIADWCGVYTPDMSEW